MTPDREHTMNTYVPCPADRTKRGDVIRFRAQGKTIEARVAGSKSLARDHLQLNTVDGEGKRRSWRFAPEEQVLKSAELRVDPSITFESLSVERAPVAHDDAPSGVFLMDAANDIAYRSGRFGVWLRLDGVVGEPTFDNIWRWDTDDRLWQVL